MTTWASPTKSSTTFWRSRGVLTQCTTLIPELFRVTGPEAEARARQQDDLVRLLSLAEEGENSPETVTRVSGPDVSFTF